MTELMLMGILETIYMTLVSTFFAYVIGLPLGIILVVTDKNGIYPINPLCTVLGIIVNIGRSIPFLILIMALLPFTRQLIGTTIGSTATIVPLTIAAAPFVARLVESSLKEVDSGVIEAAKSMGATTFQIIWKVLLREGLPSLLVGGAVAVTTILSYSAMSGIVGGGGLGSIAINYGYYRYQYDVMWITIVILVILVQIFQEFGMKFAKKFDKRL